MARSLSLLFAMAAFLAFWVTFLGAEVRAQQGTVKVVINARFWDPGQARFRPETPPGQSDFVFTNAGGVLVASASDGAAVSLAPGAYTVSEDSPSSVVFDFVVSSSGASQCPNNPAGGHTSLALAAAHFPANGTLHLCVYHKVASGAVAKALESADNATGVVTWRIRPSDTQQYMVWDAPAQSCQAFNGATCGGIGTGGGAAGSFGGNVSQYLLVTQTYDLAGACAVQNTVQWTAAPFGTAPVNADRSLTVAYTCSGAGVLGWALLIPLFIVGVLFAFLGYQRLRR